MRIRSFYAKPGMKLANPVYAESGGLIAGVGSRLTVKLIRTIKADGVRSIDIEHFDELYSWEKIKSEDDIAQELKTRFKHCRGSKFNEMLKSVVSRHLVKTNQDV